MVRECHSAYITRAGVENRRRVRKGVHHATGSAVPARRSCSPNSAATLTQRTKRRALKALRHLPVAFGRRVAARAADHRVGRRFARKRKRLLGRGLHYPIALEARWC